MDRSRLAAALAYKQAEDERKRQMMQYVPTPSTGAPDQGGAADMRTNLENLSAGLGRGITTQLEGIKGIVTDPVGTAKGVYEAGKAVVRDPAIIASALRQMGSKAMSGPLGAGEVIGEMLGPRKGGPVMQELDVYHGTPHRFPATETVNVYRGENAANVGGNYWSTDPEFAQQFTQKGLPEEVKKSTLSMSDIYNPSTPVFAGNAKAVDAAISEAKKLGKSAVRFSEGKGQPDSFYVIEKQALGKTGNPLGEFDASKIGTGEGAQAYGHGIYYAENPEVAKGYQSTLRETNAWEIDGQRAHGVRSRLDAQPINYAANALERFDGDKKAAIAWLKDSQSPMDLAAAKLLAKSKTAQKTPGSLYKADLPDEMIDRMLDWDKPLSQQPAVVREAIQRLVAQEVGPEKASELMLRQSFTGQNAMLHLPAKTSAEDSEVLRQAGIPGIKYLDAGSRGQGGSGTRNFVVFPGEEKKVRILERK